MKLRSVCVSNPLGVLVAVASSILLPLNLVETESKAQSLAPPASSAADSETDRESQRNDATEHALPDVAAKQVVDATADTDFLDQYRDAAEKRWSKEIAKFDALNQAEDHSSDSLLVIGSSSIRRWDTIQRDLAPYSAIQRGYGGAKYTDAAVFAERLITPHSFRAMVVFVGNGVTGKPDDHTPEQIEQLARHIVDVAHRHQPNAAVFLIEITPCEKRFDAWPKIRAVNAVLREIALSTPKTFFIPTAGLYLDGDGNPRPELFVEDKLHLSDAGYRLWGTLIRRRLDESLRLMAGG